jgi:hypothetical protein
VFNVKFLTTSAWILLLAVETFAQATTGTMTGTVGDTKHAPVPGASVQLKDPETASVYKTTTGLTGAYTLSQVPAGKYELTVSSFGFKPYERKDIVIQPGETLKLEIPIGDFISLDTLGEDRAGLGRMVLSRPQPPAGPTPRMPDGKPDLSGIWQGPLPGGGPGQQEPELLPAAQAILKERIDNNFKDSPTARCLPFSVTPLNALFLNRLVQTRDLLVTILEYDIPGHREIYLNGRPHPKNLEQSWTGHSIGKWEGDTLVIETVGFNDKSWIGEGTPHTEKLKVTTRLTRPDLGHLQVETTFEDPGSFKKPWTTKAVATLGPPTEEIPEFTCNENNQDVEHLVGK